jgi:predicted NAD/FAD-binding protein
MKLRIAIIGGGIAGLTAGYLLNRRHEVTLFEKSDRLGGNAYTYTTGDGLDVDMAVAAFGMAGSKKFARLISELKLKTRRIERPGICYHNLVTGRGLYATLHLKGLIAQRFAILKPGMIKEGFNLRKGLSTAKRMLDEGRLEGKTVEECMAVIPQLKGYARLILVFTLSLAASMHVDQVMSAPAEFFIRKIKIHNDFISPKIFFSVRAMANKTRSYVEALALGFRDRVALNSEIKTVARERNGVSIVLNNGRSIAFDKVVSACNADQALRLLEKPTAEEKNLLGAWRYNEGKVVLHKDYSSFPPWDLIGTFTFLYTDRGGSLRTSMNGSVRYEPGVPKDCPLIGSQYPNFPIKKELVETEKVFRTPIFDFNSCATIKMLPSLNGIMNTYYCGSHFGFGLHEDGVASAIDVAGMLGVDF